MRRLLAVGVVAITAGVLWTTSRDAPPASPQPPTARQVVGYINHQRELRNLPALSFDARLARASRRWSRHLAALGTLKHTSRLLWPPYRWAAETLYGGPGGPVRAWLRSPPHRAIILSERAKLVGIGRTGDVWVARLAAR